MALDNVKLNVSMQVVVLLREDEPMSSNKNNTSEDHCTIASEIYTMSEKLPMKPKRVVDSRIKKTILLILRFPLNRLIFCAFFALFSNAGLGPVLGSVANDLNDNKNMSWYMTVFSLASTICQLLGIRVSDCLGRY
ncbi:hypothetical protein K501DRAFT_274854 [Backusella circina FSU 941]|nr:hypothetical protein K501DRAFT_274854 [Backusella circina FSU 941]